MMEVELVADTIIDPPQAEEETALLVVAVAAPIEFTSAQNLINEAERLIQDEALSPDKKKSKARVRNILNNINRTLEIVGQVANLFPPAKLGVEVLKGLLKLEIDRRDNSEQIVIMFHSMLTMMFMLRHLDKVTLDQDDDLAHHLEQLMTIISKTMEEFGDLADLYYNKCKQPVVRFFKSGDFKLKMHMFNDQFTKYRHQLQDILLTRSEVRSKEMSEKIDRIKENTEMIIARLGQPSTDQEKKAVAIVQECGRELVLHDKAKLEEVSMLVGGGRVTGNTQALLDTGLDELLVSNMQQFHWKLESSMSQMNDTLNKAKEAILKKLDSGPYELIEDPDVKAVWKANAWRLSVKCRHFVDELSNHYEEKFRNEASKADGSPPKDQWTLSIFSKVMYHPAIGDAIDEDGSGFISLYEVNSWLSARPPTWSVPEWLVYWAIGWKLGNIKYTNMILEQLDEISEMCEVYAEKHVKEENFKHHIGVYTQKIKIMKSIASWAATVQADDSAAQDLTHEGETRLQEMIDQSAKEQANMISERLEILKYVLDDPADLPVLLGGTEIRVELVFLSIAHLILGKHEEMMTSPKEELTDGSWEEMAETLDMLTDVFHDRMQELIRGWRNQKLQVELHITCFAGGIYAGWYTAFTDPKGEMKRILEKGGSVDEPEEGTQSNTAVLAEMQRLNDKVCQLDTRIDTIMSMLQTLLEANNIKHSHTPPKREKSPPPVLDVSISGGALLSSPLSGSPELPNPNAMGSVLAPYSADPFTVPSSVIHRPPFDGPTIVPKASPPRTNAEMKSPNGSQNSQHRVRRKPTIEYRDRKDDIDDIVDGYSKRGENKNNNHNNHNNSNNANVRVEGGIEFPKLTRVALHDRPMGSMTLDSAASSSQDEPGPMSPEQQPQTEPLPMVMGRHELSKDFYAQGFYSEGQSEATATVSDAWNSTGVEAANALGMDELTGGAFSGISASANMAMKMKKPSKANLKAAMGKMTGDGDTGIGAGIGASMGVGMGVGMGVPRPSVDENAKGISGAMKGLKSSVRSRLNSLTGKKSKDWDQSSDSHSHSAHPTSPPLPTSYSMPYRDYRDVYPQPSEHGHLPRSAPTTAPLSLGNGSGGRTPLVNNSHYNHNNNHGNHNPHESHHMSPSPPSSKPKDLRSHHPTESEGHPYGYAYDGVDSPSWLSEPPSTRTFPHQPPSVSPRPRPPSGPRTRGLSMQNPNPPAVQNYTHTRRLAAGETGHQAGGASIKPRDNMF